MYYARCLTHLLDWQGADSFDDITAETSDDWVPVGHSYSFYETESNDFLCTYNRGIAAYMICVGKKTWVQSIGIILFKKDDIDKIQPLGEPAPYPLGLFHRDMKDLTKSIRDKLEKLTFDNKDFSHQYTVEEIRERFRLFSLENWNEVFEFRRKDKDQLEDRVNVIVNRFFNSNSRSKIPDSLKLYVEQEGLTLQETVE